VPIDSARRDESNGIYFEWISTRPPAKVQPGTLGAIFCQRYLGCRYLGLISN